MSSEQRENGVYRKTNKEAMRDTAESVIHVWSKGPFPHISKAGIIKKIEKIHNTNRTLHKHKNMANERSRIREQEVDKENIQLFDISTKDWKQEVIKDRNNKKISHIGIEYLERCKKGEEVGPFG